MRFLCLIVLFFYSQTSFCERLILSLAEKTFIPLPSDQKVRIGDKSLVAIHQEQGLLSLLGKKEGRTLLIAGKKQYELFVFNKEKKSQALKLDTLLKSFWGLDWSFSNKNIFQITGRLNRLYDWVNLAKVSQKNNILYEFKALPGEGLKPQIAHYFKIFFKDKISPEIAWHKLPFANLPQGVNILEYEKLLQPFGLIPKEDPLWLLKKPFIEIEMALVESLSSSSFSFGGGADSKNSLSSFSSLLAFLNFLKNSGQGKTLHRSSITGQSGQKLQIQSGGQLPFNSYNLKTEQKSVQWKSYGLQLNILPKLDKKNQIELDIKAKISEPLSFSSLDSPPPLKSQSLESKVILKDKQILKLFQLQKKSKGVQNRGYLGFLLPFSGSFLSGNNRYKITQFVFIQAKIVKNKTDKSPLKKEGQDLLLKRKGDF